MQGSAKRVGAAPPLRQRRKKQTSRQHKTDREKQVRKCKLNRRYPKMCSKGITSPTRTKSREQMYRRFNFTKQRSAFRETPYPPSGGQKPIRSHNSATACLAAGLELCKNRVRSFAQLNRRYILFTVLCVRWDVSALTARFLVSPI